MTRTGEGARRHAARGVLVASIVVGLGAVPPAAHADPEPVWSSSDSTPLLPPDETLGTFSFPDERTERSRGSGPCPSEEDPDGYPHARIFHVTTGVASRLDLAVTDDLDESLSLCRIAVYRGRLGDEVLSDVFDQVQRDRFRRTAQAGCASGPACRLRIALAAHTTYVVVLWAAPPADGDPTRAEFSLTGSLKRPVDFRVSVGGHRIRNRCNGTYEFVRGRTIRMVARASAPVRAAARVRWYERTDDGLRRIASYGRAVVDGRFSIRLQPGRGKREIRIRLIENDRLYPRARALERFLIVVPKAERFADGGLRLKVRYRRQQHRLSCEAATLRMAHNYFHPGRIDRDKAVYRITGHEERRRPNRDGGCDPDRAFCGNIDGRMMRDGYGVHAGPIARAATHYDPCRPALHLDGYRLKTIARHVRDGHPVIVWGAHAGPTGIYRYRWRAWNGNQVTAYSVEHVWTVIGFRGPASRPTHFIVHDPSGERNDVVTRARFRRFTDYFGTAVVVRG